MNWKNLFISLLALLFAVPSISEAQISKLDKRFGVKKKAQPTENKHAPRANSKPRQVIKNTTSEPRRYNAPVTFDDGFVSTANASQVKYSEAMKKLQQIDRRSSLMATPLCVVPCTIVDSDGIIYNETLDNTDSKILFINEDVVVTKKDLVKYAGNPNSDCKERSIFHLWDIRNNKYLYSLLINRNLASCEDYSGFSYDKQNNTLLYTVKTKYKGRHTMFVYPLTGYLALDFNNNKVKLGELSGNNEIYREDYKYVGLRSFNHSRDVIDDTNYDFLLKKKLEILFPSIDYRSLSLRQKVEQKNKTIGPPEINNPNYKIEIINQPGVSNYVYNEEAYRLMPLKTKNGEPVEEHMMYGCFPDLPVYFINPKDKKIRHIPFLQRFEEYNRSELNFREFNQIELHYTLPYYWDSNAGREAITVGYYEHRSMHYQYEGPLVYNENANQWQYIDEVYRINGGISGSAATLLRIWNNCPGSSTLSYFMAFGDGDGCLIKFDDRTKRGHVVKRWNGFWNQNVKPVWMEDRKWLFLPEKSVNVWNVYELNENSVSVKQIFTLYVGLGGKEYAIVLPNGHYAGSPGCENLVSCIDGRKDVNLEVFAPWRNRPAEVLEALDGNPDDIVALRETTRRWLRKKGFDMDNMPPEPKVSDFSSVAVPKVPLFVKSSSLRFNAKVNASAKDVTKLEVRVDGVLAPQLFDGFLQIKSGSSEIKEINVSLCNGENWVEITPIDKDGLSGKTEKFRVVYEGYEKSDMYVVTLGVSDYDNDALDLRYAAKDAKDLAATLKVHGYGDVYTFTLIDKDVKDLASFEKVREFLMKSKINDRVVFYIAGHGMLDDKLDYYYAPAGFDVERIAETGISMDVLTGILNECPARKKVLLLDTCHSGVLGEAGEELLALSGVQLPHGVRAIQNRGMKIKKAHGVLKSTTQKKRYIEDMFSMGGGIRGINIVAGASGAEFALESDQWQNGVFTANIIRALKEVLVRYTPPSDTYVNIEALDYVGKIKSLDDIIEKVSSRVYQMTGGKQKVNIVSAGKGKKIDISTYLTKKEWACLEYNVVKNNMQEVRSLLVDRKLSQNIGETTSEDLLQLAIKKGNVELLKLLLDYGFSVNSISYIDEALKKNDVSILKDLSAREIDLPDFEEELYQSHLKEICSRLKWLHKVGIDITPYLDKMQLSALERAIIVGNREEINLYAKNIDYIQSNYSMMLAIALKDLETIKLFINMGYDINTTIRIKNSDHSVIDYVWKSENMIEIIKLFIKKNNDKKLLAEVLCSAVYNGVTDAAKLLIEAGVDVNAKNSYGNTALFYTRNAEFAKLLIEAGADVNAKDKDGETALFYTRNAEIAKLLIEAGVDVNAKDKYGETALLGVKNAEIEKLLIEAGADVNAKNDYKRTALFGVKNAEIVKLLIEAGVDVNAKDKGGETALFRVENAEIAKLLIEAGVDVNAKDKCGETALLGVKNAEIEKLLIEAGADVNAKDRYGVPALFGVKNAEIAKLFIEAGADVNVKDKGGATALFYTRNAEIAKLLIEAGADVNAKHKGGQTALFGVENAEIVKLLIEAGVDVNVKDKGGETALFYTRNAEIAKLLIEAGADVNAKDKGGETALFGVESAEIAKLLIEAGADVNAKNNDERTALFYTNNIGVAKLLIEAGADLRDGNTILNALIERVLSSQNDEEISFIKLLKKYGVTEGREDLGSGYNITHTPEFSRRSVPQSELNKLLPLYQRLEKLKCKQEDSKVQQKVLLVFLAHILNGSDVNMDLPNAGGVRALHVSCALGSLSITEWLLRNGADPNHMTDRGAKPMQFVGSDNRNAIMRLLRQYGAR